jgi:iron(III) transport system substrate-binding protein
MSYPTPARRVPARRFAALRLTNLVTLACLALPLGPAWAGGEVNIYSYREPRLMNPLLKTFTAKTGIKANMIYAGSGLIERISAEGRNSPADVILTNEFGLLVQAVEAGVTQPISSKALEDAIPAAYRDPAGHWFGLTRRARVVYASKSRVPQSAITYEELADPKWKGKICIRSGQHTYNISLFAFMIAKLGPEKAEAWLNGLKENLARKPAAGDREAVRDVASGQCDIGIGNTYYMAAIASEPEHKDWADGVRIIFPGTESTGTHMNISGAAVAANAPDKDNAIALLEFLASPEAQQMYASANGEYPVREGVPVTDLIKSWGTPKADPLPLAEIAKLRKAASDLVDKVHFDQGPQS